MRGNTDATTHTVHFDSLSSCVSTSYSTKLFELVVRCSKEMTSALRIVTCSSSYFVRLRRDSDAPTVEEVPMTRGERYLIPSRSGDHPEEERVSLVAEKTP